MVAVEALVGEVIVADAGDLADFGGVACAPSKLLTPKISVPAITTFWKSFDIFCSFHFCRLSLSHLSYSY